MLRMLGGVIPTSVLAQISSSSNLEKKGQQVLFPVHGGFHPRSSALRVTYWAAEPPSGTNRHSRQPKL